MKCSARGDSQTDQQVNKLIALNPIGWLCLWAAGAIAENALHALRAFGRLPVRTVAVAARRAVAFARPQTKCSVPHGDERKKLGRG